VAVNCKIVVQQFTFFSKSQIDNKIDQGRDISILIIHLIISASYLIAGTLSTDVLKSMA